MSTKNRVDAVLMAVVLAAAAAGCSAATEQAATSRISAESTGGLAGAPDLPAPASSATSSASASASYQVIPIDSLPFPEPGRSPLSAARQQALQAAVNRAIADPAASGVQGVTAAVVSPEGSWAGAAGVDGAATQLTPTSMIDIASITKTVTAAEVLHLAGAGLIDLDAPASDYHDHPRRSRHCSEAAPARRQLRSQT